MRVPLIGMGGAAVLVCGWLELLRIPPSQRMGIIIWLFVAFCAVMMGGTSLLRQLRSNSWEPATAKILSCSQRFDGDSWQNYDCSYVYEVDGARQGGSFIIWNANAGLDQVQAAVVGKSVIVKYSPQDCTQSMIAANSINGWKVQKGPASRLSEIWRLP